MKIWTWIIVVAVLILAIIITIAVLRKKKANKENLVIKDLQPQMPENPDLPDKIRLVDKLKEAYANSDIERLKKIADVLEL